MRQSDTCPACSEILDFVPLRGEDGCHHGRYVASCPHCDQGRPVAPKRQHEPKRRCAVCQGSVDDYLPNVRVCENCRDYPTCPCCGARCRKRGTRCMSCKALNRIIEEVTTPFVAPPIVPRRVRTPVPLDETGSQWVARVNERNTHKRAQQRGYYESRRGAA